MNTDYLIKVDEYCACNDIDVSFISSLQQTGLIELTTIEESRFLDTEQLQQLERYIRFYYELNINLCMSSNQIELFGLKNKRHFFDFSRIN